MTEIFLYAANLHVGGAIQVATSVIDEFSRRPADACRISLLVSSEIDKNLRALDVSLDGFLAYRVDDHRGLSALFANLPKLIGKADVVFTVFGPLYCRALPVPNVVGFAQPWIIYPNNEVYRGLSAPRKFLTRMKFWVQSLFFRRADVMIVELDHVKAGLIRTGIARDDQVRVVQNCLSSLYGQPERWLALAVPDSSADFKLGFIGRNYPHKNTGIFPDVRRLLQQKHGLDVCIYVTFSEDEWHACTPEFRAATVNVGPLSVAQCPAFYQAMDGVIFPSVLECFSATPLETMAMRRPLFASDRAFNRDVCADHARYFDPLDAENVAGVIAAYILETAKSNVKLDSAYAHALSFPSAAERARQYLDCLLQAAKDKSSLNL